MTLHRMNFRGIQGCLSWRREAIARGNRLIVFDYSKYSCMASKQNGSIGSKRQNQGQWSKTMGDHFQLKSKKKFLIVRTYLSQNQLLPQEIMKSLLLEIFNKRWCDYFMGLQRGLKDQIGKINVMDYYELNVSLENSCVEGLSSNVMVFGGVFGM